MRMWRLRQSMYVCMFVCMYVGVEVHANTLSHVYILIHAPRIIYLQCVSLYLQCVLLYLQSVLLYLQCVLLYLQCVLLYVQWLVRGSYAACPS
jgi:hypothetical protein